MKSATRLLVVVFILSVFLVGCRNDFNQNWAHSVVGYKISKKLFWKTGFHRLEAGKKEKGQSRKKDTIFGSRYFQRGYSESSL